MVHWRRMVWAYQFARHERQWIELQRAPSTGIVLALPFAVAGWAFVLWALRSLLFG